MGDDASGTEDPRGEAVTGGVSRGRYRREGSLASVWKLLTHSAPGAGSIQSCDESVHQRFCDLFREERRNRISDLAINLPPEASQVIAVWQ